LVFEIPENCYRTFGNPEQTIIFSQEELNDLIERNPSGNPCFISTCWFDEEHNHIVPIVFFDFDNEILEDSWKDTKKLAKYFERKQLIPFYIFFTGNRGFHIHLHVKPKKYSNGELRIFQEFLIDKLSLKSACRHVVGQTRRMCRIPNTKHEDTGLYCIQVNLNQKLDEILELSKQPQPLKIELFPEYYDLRQLIKRFRINNLKKSSNNNIQIRENINYANCDNKFYKELFKFHPCLLNEILTEEPANSVRVWTVSFLLEQGFSLTWIFKFFESCHWIDWNPSKTAYHLKRVKENGGYATPRCKLIQSGGYCLGKKCKNFVETGEIF